MGRNSSIIFPNQILSNEEENLGEELEVENLLFIAKNIFVFCEGKTEFNYFTGFDSSHNNSRLKIIPRYPRHSTGAGNSGEGCNFDQLCTQVKNSVDNKIVEIHDINRNYSHTVYENDEFNIIFDCDKNFDSINNPSKYNIGQNIISSLNVKIYLSNYSFEIWILCHFEIPPNNLMSNTNLRIGEILPDRINQQHIPNYEKNDRLIFNKLKQHTETAINNSKILLSQNKTRNTLIHSKQSEPVTEIGLFLEKLKKELI